MMSSVMEITEAPAEEPASCTHQSEWLQSTITDVDAKMKEILDLLDEDDSPLQNAEICVRKKDTIRKVLQDLSISYRSLAEKYVSLKSVEMNVQSSESSLSSNKRSMKNMEALGTRDDTQLEATDSNPESTVEDADIDNEDSMTDVGHIKRFADDLVVAKDGTSIMSGNAAVDGVKFKFSKLVERNTQLQVELIRRNSEKRETIIKLQDQVSKLRVKNDTLKRTLSYFNRNHEHIQENYTRRKSILLDKFFKGCSP